MPLINQVQEIKHLSEDLFIEPKGIFPGIYEDHKYDPPVYKKMDMISRSYIPEMMIERNLRDDTFNVKFKLDKHMIIPFRTNFQINGKTIDAYQGFHDHEIQDDILNDILPHALIKDAKFSSTKSIAAGMVYKNHIDDPHYFLHKRYSRQDLGAFLVVINNIVKNQSISVTADNIIHIQTINSIKITKDVPLYILRNSQKFSNNPFDSYYKIFNPTNDNDQNVSFEYSYNHIYLKPSPISRYSHNTKIYDVFMSNDDDSPIIGDMKITNGIMSTSETGNSKMQIGFHSKLNDNHSAFIDGRYRKHIGYYSLEDYSYYDYEKNKTIFGPSINAKRGDLVPYNLHGNYIRQIQLGLNCDYDALKIYQSKLFDKPVLKPFSGSVKLAVNNSNFDDSIQMIELSQDDITNIKDNFDSYLLSMEN